MTGIRSSSQEIEAKLAGKIKIDYLQPFLQELLQVAVEHSAMI
jgi:hypothetical protein